ncbi:MAG: hypothetical protein AAGJ87_15050 [Pseudomonadota bacterium]
MTFKIVVSLLAAATGLALVQIGPAVAAEAVEAAVSSDAVAAGIVSAAFVLDDPSKADPLPTTPVAVGQPARPVKAPPSPVDKAAKHPQPVFVVQRKFDQGAPTRIKSEAVDAMWRSTEDVYFTDFFKAHQ